MWIWCLFLGILLWFRCSFGCGGSFWGSWDWIGFYFICGLGGFEFLFGLGVVWGELDEYGVFCGGEWWGEGGFVEFVK